MKRPLFVSTASSLLLPPQNYNDQLQNSQLPLIFGRCDRANIPKFPEQKNVKQSSFASATSSSSKTATSSTTHRLDCIQPTVFRSFSNDRKTTGNPTPSRNGERPTPSCARSNVGLQLKLGSFHTKAQIRTHPSLLHNTETTPSASHRRWSQIYSKMASLQLVRRNSESIARKSECTQYDPGP